MRVALLSWYTERRPALKLIESYSVFPCCAKFAHRARRPSFDRVGRHERTCPLCSIAYVVDVEPSTRFTHLYRANWQPVTKTVAA